MKSRQLRCADAAPRSDRSRAILETIKDRYVSVPPRFGGYSSYLDGRADGEAGCAKRDIFDFPVPSQERLQELFDLTVAEAKLAQLLACGDSVEEVALKLNIKMTTARTQLAAVFSKTETRRQAKLVAILSRIAHLEEHTAKRASRMIVVDPAQVHPA